MHANIGEMLRSLSRSKGPIRLRLFLLSATRLLLVAAKVVTGGVGDDRAATARIYAQLEGAEVDAGRCAQLVSSQSAGCAAFLP